MHSAQGAAEYSSTHAEGLDSEGTKCRASLAGAAGAGENEGFEGEDEGARRDIDQSAQSPKRGWRIIADDPRASRENERHTDTYEYIRVCVRVTLFEVREQLVLNNQ